MSDTVERLKAALADRYAIEREIGAGGMATVYLAEDLKHKRKVAVKVLRPELAATLGPERFVREIEIAARLTHPHILPLHDSGEADGFLYYVMPYVEGESLRERLDREGKLSVDDGIRITDQVASALSYAHEQGVVHRDVKPENIMLAGDQAIVADFGIARAVQAAGGEKLTGTGLAIGTPAYMSPEQAMGLEEVDARSDVYALGCVVYEMVVGRTPFEGSTPQALLAKHAVDTVPGLRASDPAIPVYVERAVERALAKSPADRFQSASAFAEALTTGTVVARVGRRRWRRRSVVGAATAVVLLLAAGGWWLATTTGGPAIERLAVLPFTNLMNDPEQEYLVRGMHSALMTELAQAGVTVVGGVQSMMRYQNTQMTVREIADELGVGAVIEGSVFWIGDSVGIDARLLHGGTEATLWSHSYGGDVRDVLTLYRDLTRAIADEIQLVLTPEAEARLAGARPVNPEAYEAYLKGRFNLDKQSSADLGAALQYFELALEKDPNYALAYVGIAGVWASRQQHGFAPTSEAGPRVKAAALKALELDSTVAEVHQLLGVVKLGIDWDWEGAEAAFERAIALKPNYPGARALYSYYLMILGRPDEAMAQIERAVELDPFNDLFQNFYGIDLLFARRYDEAIAQFQNALKTAPNNPMSRTGLQDAFHAKGRNQEALAEWKAMFAAEGERELEEALERGYAEGGYREAMRRAAETWAARSPGTFVPPLGLAQLFAHAGERERVLEWLQQAYEARDPNLPGIGVIPLFDSVRDDPRFQDLLRRMNLPGRNDE
ncbi:MAG: protein kinase [Gemmatimonadetes bacterium]|nr:protein kinase [Gemmatimonadota bacterium]